MRGCYADWPLRHALRTVVWWPSCRCRGIRARRVPCAPAGAIAGNAVDERDRICIPCAVADGSGFDAISWDEAFAQIAERLWGLLTSAGLVRWA
ncbi:MAG: hypothetical protein ACLTYW_00645 [Collinsella sp.]